ncbi:MAG: hypothetical protein V7K38_16010 [Nostoc sp.]|uniref:hypothetical protein n=1 Tax=Nostoc sp. TaxID=1180 RepID=UPI002FF9092D
MANIINMAIMCDRCCNILINFHLTGGCVTVLHGLGASDCKTTPKRLSWEEFSNTIAGKGFKFDGTEVVTAGVLVLAGVCVFLVARTRIDTEKFPEAGLGFGFVSITCKKAPEGSDWLFPKEILIVGFNYPARRKIIKRSRCGCRFDGRVSSWCGIGKNWKWRSQFLHEQS